jgi:hypothetical protein
MQSWLAVHNASQYYLHSIEARIAYRREDGCETH